MSEATPDERIEHVRKQLNAAGQSGNWDYDPYMHGMYNGLECALATLEGREPIYRSAPKEWLQFNVFREVFGGIGGGRDRDAKLNELKWTQNPTEKPKKTHERPMPY